MDYKEQQKQYSERAKKVKVLTTSPKGSQPVNLNIKAFKQTGVSQKEIKKYKQKVWQMLEEQTE